MAVLQERKYNIFSTKYIKEGGNTLSKRTTRYNQFIQVILLNNNALQLFTCSFVYVADRVASFFLDKNLIVNAKPNSICI